MIVEIFISVMMIMTVINLVTVIILITDDIYDNRRR